MRNATILVVDDEIDNLKVFLAFLKTSGFNILIAESGVEALRQAETAQPDLILLDVLMPDIDGIETCRRLKVNEAVKEIPVIFMTALAETIDKVRGFEVGSVDYITKPFQHAELIARIKTHLMIRDQHRQIKQQNQQLQELNACKDMFFSIIAHDLKNPFAGLLVIANLIKEKIDQWSKTEITYWIDQLQASSENLHALLDNLLTWARIQQGTIGFYPREFDIQPIIGRNMAIFAQNAKQKQITLQNLLQLQLAVYADVNMLDVIVRNLLSNAIKFTKAGGSVVVSATSSDTTVEVAVSDTGIGIHPEKLPHLFRIESKHQQIGTAGERGTGLGLILCKEFIRKQSGDIWVESEIGQGTTIRFTLPRREAHDRH